MAVRINGSRSELPALAMLCMKTLNFYMLIFTALMMCVSSYGIIRQGSSYEFFSQLAVIPAAPWKFPVLIFLGYMALMLLMSAKKESIRAAIWYGAAEIAICIWMSWFINFTYTGVLLLSIAEITGYIKKTKYVNVILGISFIAYLLADHSLWVQAFDMNSFEAYLSYYSADKRAMLAAVRNVGVGINILFFVFYMILVLRGQRIENTHMQQMNEELNKLNEELNRANAQLEENAKTIAEMTQIEERNRLAREIHDTLGHALTGIITGIDACIELIMIAPEAVKKQLEIIADVARQGMTDVRRSVKALRPDALEKMELDAAIESMIENIRLSTHVNIAYNCTVDLKRFGNDEEEVIYRIVQESITNAIRHGRASKIDVSITGDSGAMTIKVSDNGIGCKNIKNGFGLCHMRERLELLGGSLDCDGSEGFKLTARMPVRFE